MVPQSCADAIVVVRTNQTRVGERIFWSDPALKEQPWGLDRAATEDDLLACFEFESFLIHIDNDS